MLSGCSSPSDVVLALGMLLWPWGCCAGPGDAVLVLGMLCWRWGCSFGSGDALLAFRMLFWPWGWFLGLLRAPRAQEPQLPRPGVLLPGASQCLLLLPVHRGVALSPVVFSPHRLAVAMPF